MDLPVNNLVNLITGKSVTKWLHLQVTLYQAQESILSLIESDCNNARKWDSYVRKMYQRNIC